MSDRKGKRASEGIGNRLALPLGVMALLAASGVWARLALAPLPAPETASPLPASPATLTAFTLAADVPLTAAQAPVGLAREVHRETRPLPLPARAAPALPRLQVAPARQGEADGAAMRAAAPTPAPALTEADRPGITDSEAAGAAMTVIFAAPPVIPSRRAAVTATPGPMALPAISPVRRGEPSPPPAEAPTAMADAMAGGAEGREEIGTGLDLTMPVPAGLAALSGTLAPPRRSLVPPARSTVAARGADTVSGDGASVSARDFPLAMTRPAGTNPCTSPHTASIPGRPRNAATGSALSARLDGATGHTRDATITREILAGNLPEFQRRLVPVTLSGPGADGRQTEITLCVTPDYLALGSDSDFIRVPLGLPSASRIAESFGMMLPTTAMVDAIHAQAQIRLTPSPIAPGPQMASTAWFVRHNATLEGQRRAAGGRLGQLVSGHKKDLVLTPRLQTAQGRVAIYGWHRASGRPIQPLSTVHGAHYADYSHGLRLVSQRAYVDGRPADLRDLLADPRYAAILSREGPIGASVLLAARF